MSAREKLAELERMLRSLGSVGVAYSGGTDSAFLLKVAHEVLGDRAVGLIAVSRALPTKEREDAIALAGRIGARLIQVHVDELSLEEYASNPLDRCYHCKRHILARIMDAANSVGLSQVVDGVNADDLASHGQGMRASRELGVRSPLAEAGLRKVEVRSLSGEAGLPTADKPHSACLATRIPYGQRITVEKLQQVERAEDELRELGVGQMRVRHHGAVARIEVMPDDFQRVLANRERIVSRLKGLGFSFVCLDVEGFRSGSLEPTKAGEKG